MWPPYMISPNKYRRSSHGTCVHNGYILVKVATGQRAAQVPSHLAVVVQVVGCQLATAQKVTSVEWVVHVPAKATARPWQVANSKLLAL